MVPSSDGTLVYNPHEYYRYNPLINPSEIGLICTKLANELGHHFVELKASQKLPMASPLASMPLPPTAAVAELMGANEFQPCHRFTIPTECQHITILLPHVFAIRIFSQCGARPSDVFWFINT